MLGLSARRTEIEMRFNFLQPFPSDSVKYDENLSGSAIATLMAAMKRWGEDILLQDEMRGMTLNLR